MRVAVLNASKAGYVDCRDCLVDVREGRGDRRQAVVARIRASQCRTRERHGLVETRIRIVESCSAAGQEHLVEADGSWIELPKAHHGISGTVIGLDFCSKKAREGLLIDCLGDVG